MKKTLKIALTFCLFTGVLFSQQFLPIQHDTSVYSHELIIGGTAEIGSTSLRNELTSKILLGGEITDDIKQASFLKHSFRNRVGVDLNSEVEYRNMEMNFLNNNKIGLLLRGGYYSIGSVNYSKDLFGLFFYGNNDFLNEKIDFSLSNFSFSTFQKFGVGCINKVSKSNVSLNLYTVNNYYKGEVQTGEIIQNQEGTDFTLNLKGEFSESIGQSYIKGVGFGIDVDYRFDVKIKNNFSTFQFLTKNFGVVNYFDGVKKYEIDSTYNYQGFKINQISGGNYLFKDSTSILDSLNTKVSIRNSSFFLPGFFQFGKIVVDNFNGKFQPFYGIRIYTAIPYVPMVFLGSQYSPHKNVDLGMQFSVGGFSSFKTGIYASFKTSKWAVGIASQDVYGSISKKGFGDRKSVV